MFVQKPLLSRGMLGLLGLLLAISTFAFIITIALSSVVGRSAADRDLAIQVAQARQAAAQTGTSTVEGTVIELSTGAPAQDVTVLLFGADDPSQPVKTQATGTDGAFAMSDLPAGEYTLQVTGAGFAPVWYPAAVAQPDAQPVELTTGQTVDGLTVVVGGVPATLAGSVTGDDVGGAQLTVELPLDVPPLAGEVGPEPGEATATGEHRRRGADRPDRRGRHVRGGGPALARGVRPGGLQGRVRQRRAAGGRRRRGGPQRHPAVAR